MSSDARSKDSRGPFNTTQLCPGDRYELSEGHPIYCAPTGGDGSRANAIGASVLETDPDVDSAGVDAGYASSNYTLRAPDIAVGGIPDQPGWIAGTPPLAVEYASRGQDEAELQAKIEDLIDAGTRFVWVVRLIGPRRVEVYEKGVPMRTLGPGEKLTAPGVLRNPVLVEALYDRNAAHEATLNNLLQRRGYENLDEVRTEGIEKGIEQGIEKGIEQGLEKALGEMRVNLLEALTSRSLAPTPAQLDLLNRCKSLTQITTWIRKADKGLSLEDVFAE